MDRHGVNSVAELVNFEIGIAYFFQNGIGINKFLNCI